jgi:hypothetical protein
MRSSMAFSRAGRFSVMRQTRPATAYLRVANFGVVNFRMPPDR